jgi:hypothetical protein
VLLRSRTNIKTCFLKAKEQIKDKFSGYLSKLILVDKEQPICDSSSDHAEKLTGRAYLYHQLYAISCMACIDFT